jgi:hypothetical protein
MYVITDLNDNHILLGPVEWNSMNFSSLISKHFDTEIVIHDEYRERLPLKITSVEIRECEVIEEDYNQLTQILKGPFWHIDEKTEIKKCVYKAIEIPMANAIAKARRLISEERWKRESKDLDLEMHGKILKVSTSRENRKSLYQKYLIAEENNMFNWKFINGYATLNKNDCLSLIKKIDAHVQSQYDWELKAIDEVSSAKSVHDIEAFLKSEISSLKKKRRKNG